MRGVMSQDIELLTPKDVKTILKCSLPNVYKMAGNILPCVKWGTGNRHTIRFKKDDVFQFIESHYTKQKDG